eukprot:COSAG01_NODE_54876_length_329_cov_0.669565_1_plen_73_part_00
MRSTFQQLRSAIGLHGALDVAPLLKLVTTSAMAPAAVAAAVAAAESDALERLPSLLQERKRLQNKVYTISAS